MKGLKNKWKFHKRNIISIFILITVLVTLSFSILLVKQKLLQNTQSLGMSLAKSFANEEETQIDAYRNILNLGTQYVDELYISGNTGYIQKWLQNYFQKISVIMGDKAVDPYAVIDGEIVAANPWSGDEDYDYKSTEWYKKAIQADGAIIFTDVYQDAITGQSVVTVAQKMEGDGDVMVMDLYLDKFQKVEDMEELSEDCSFYLCDGSGNLISYYISWDISDELIQQNADYLLKGIREGTLASYDDSFTDYNGEERGAYYCEMSNGWTVILTIPFESVLMGERNTVVNVLVVAACFLFIVLFVLVIRDFMQMKKMRLSEITVRILGDSFYAIYLIDYKKGTYDFIKPAEDIKKSIPSQGTYDVLKNEILSHIEEGEKKEFAASFSIENIRNRVINNINDYGGDYKRRFDSTYKWVNVRTLYNEKVDPNTVIFCFRDVELEKRQQQQHTVILSEALETARESAKDKQRFFSGMSHNMRTPLNVIIGYAELVLKNGENWEKIKDYMDHILYAGRQLLTLINDILELSRMESGKSSVNYQNFDIKSCITDSVLLFKEMAVSQEKSLEYDIKIQNCHVLGDPFKLEQIMNNLLSNAFKYTNTGAKINVKVRETVSMKRSKYEIIVSDTGIGMSEEFLKHIFDPYTRETSFTTKTISGTGLGMPIVKSLVQQFSGEITAESRLGEGSSFKVVLPLEIVNKSFQKEADENNSNLEIISMKGRRILLVEDNELNMEIASEILDMNGVTVEKAVNGEEAVRIFASSVPFHFDAILMDMQMPVMDGCEATRRIRTLERPDAQSVPIIAVTANAFAEDIARTANAGMNGHICKPIDFNVLTQTLGKFWGKKGEK